MEPETTCGQGLAEHSLLPAKMGDLLAALAENLEIHMQALTSKDPSTRLERAAYTKLARRHRRLADQLQAAAAQMAGYRDLPMGQHDARAMSDLKVLEAFATFVELERVLLEHLRQSVPRDEHRLAALKPPGDPGA